MPTKIRDLKFAWLESKPSCRPPSAYELERRRQLRAEIDAIRLGKISEADQLAIDEKIKHKVLWYPMGS